MTFKSIFLLFLLFLSSCFKKETNSSLLLDFDTQKKIDMTIKEIVFDANAFSGSYVTYADSLSPYGFTIKSNLKLLDVKNKTIKISSYISRNSAKDLGSIALQIVNVNQENVFSHSMYFSEANFVKPNEWTKIEETIKLPDNPKIFDSQNTLKIFLYNTKNRILMDNLEISSQ